MTTDPAPHLCGCADAKATYAQLEREYERVTDEINRLRAGQAALLDLTQRWDVVAETMTMWVHAGGRGLSNNMELIDRSMAITMKGCAEQIRELLGAAEHAELASEDARPAPSSLGDVPTRPRQPGQPGRASSASLTAREAAVSTPPETPTELRGPHTRPDFETHWGPVAAKLRP